MSGLLAKAGVVLGAKPSKHLGGVGAGAHRDADLAEDLFVSARGEDRQAASVGVADREAVPGASLTVRDTSA